MSVATDVSGRPTSSTARDRTAAGDLLLSQCQSLSDGFLMLVRRAAAEHEVEERALAVRTLLHLPRLAEGGWLTVGRIEAELRRVAGRLAADTAGSAGTLMARSAPSRVSDLTFTLEAGEELAASIFSRLHYLRSARHGAVNCALLDPESGLPVTICSVSPLEWKRVRSHLSGKCGFPEDQISDVARVYSCAAAPPNAISYLLSRVRRAFAPGGDSVLSGRAQLLITVVDPNLGFGGASYRAANWQQWLTVKPRPYLYCDGWYATPRQLRERFGSSSLPELRRSTRGHEFVQSPVGQLADSMIFCCPVGEPIAFPVSEAPLRRRSGHRSPTGAQR